MERCDVLIVGGGPAGSSCAWGLRDAGLDVAVFDRKRFPRDKICAGWVTPQVLSALELDPNDYRKGRVMQPITGFAVERAGDEQTRVDYGEVVSWGIRRCEFDHALLERCGARLHLGRPLVDLRREAGRWVLNGELSARVLVGAGGHFCPVARHLGVRPGESEPTTVVAREVEFELTPEQQRECPAAPELPELIFEADLRGYGWVVRKGDWLNVGLGRQDQQAFPGQVQRFLAWLAANGRIPHGTPRGLKGHAYLLYAEAPRPLTRDGVLLLGDAAGLAYGRSGEGIRPAVESGLLAARALRENASPEGAGQAYEVSMLERFGPRIGRPQPGLTRWIPRRWRGAAAGRLLATPWFARNVVVSSWFLHREIPPLAA
ncbi:MAG: NAD(P)/FAD-dependent oxidoreductase [Myxococcota bacterium]|nr:NAD(P)/FAD-dependent oxidoreductase [Myxococcota bacterium]